MQQVPNMYTSFALTEEEEQDGYRLKGTTQAVIHNLRAAAAEEILQKTLRCEIEVPEERERIKYIQGQLDILTHILTLNTLHGEALVEEVSEQQDANLQ